MFSSSMILLRPKSVILISPLTDPLPRRMFPVKYRIDTLMTVKYTTNHSNISTNLSLTFQQGIPSGKVRPRSKLSLSKFYGPGGLIYIKKFFLISGHLTWFEVIVNHRWFDFIEILEGADRLRDDGPRLLLWNGFVLLQVKVKVVSLAVF